MGWETRARGGLYYVRKQRENKRVVSIYLGNGEVACAIAALDHAEQQERAAEARAERQIREEQAEQERDRQKFCSSVRAEFRQHMEAGGWYQHRGQWRKGRGATMAITKDTAGAERIDLFRKAEAGDAKAAAELFALYKKNGALDALLDIAYQVEFDYAQARSYRNRVLEAAIRHRSEKMRKDLTGDDDTPLERLLIERVIVCQHDLSDAAAQAARLEPCAMEKHEHYSRTVDRAQRRYLMAVRELGIARRLRLPTRAVQESETRLRLTAGGLKPGRVMLKESA
jgi:hypothetical protein